ncbi:TetR family transcriptional regulator [Geodermatophilus normandii]|uniref:TetR family transcriptional regulator n=1 Tax=Geodermatophilus normandii TaxID=1137989 RepID=A0A317QPZ4_9ACTN|nr:TetR/AcrR family transcriptional regulator [Geodermatophilus normandii]PWW24957.1 TetR family transcriptional regulator [Geodermatophilus normandii]
MLARREAIVAAALDVIQEEGLSGFTQPRVARRAGLRQSHLTYYFPTRADLLLAVADEAVRRRIEALRTAVSAEDPAAKVAGLVEVLVDPRQTRILTALTQSADADPGVRRAFAALGAGIAPLGAELISSFGAEPTEASLALLQATSTGIAVLALATGAEAFRGRAEHVLTQLLTGLRTEQDCT